MTRSAGQFGRKEVVLDERQVGAIAAAKVNTEKFFKGE